MISIELGAVAVIFTLAAFVQATTGFGFSLAAIPLLTLIVAPDQAIVSATAASAALSGGAALRYRASIQREAVIRYTWTGFLGIPLGVLVLLKVSESTLTALIGLIVLVAVVAMLFRFRALGPRWQFSAGFLGGALLSSTGLGGPPIVIGLDGLRLAPNEFRATAQAIFVFQQLGAIAIFAVAGLVTRDVLSVVAVSVLALPVGWTVGGLVFDRLNPGRFRAGTLVMLVLSASVALLSVV